MPHLLHGTTAALDAIKNFLSTRRGMTVAAWVLLLLGIVWPTSLSSLEGGAFRASTGLYAFANLIRPEMYPPSPFAALPRSTLCAVAFFTNLVFLFGIWFRDNPAPSRGFRAVLIAAVAVDVLVGFVLRDFARLVGYWIWVAGVVAMILAFVARPAKGKAEAAPAAATAPEPEPASAPVSAKAGRKKGATATPPGKATTGLPEIVWWWIGWLVFWTAVTLLTPWIEGTTVPEAQEAKAKALTGYVNDATGALRPATVEKLAAALAQFEKDTSTQFAVAIYPQLPAGSLEDFTIDVAEKSRLGRKGLDNGAILSIFTREKAARVEVGYGLEGALTDVQAHRILETALAPAWAAGDRDKAVEDTVAAITGTVREEFRAGRMPGRLAIFWRQLTVEIPRLVKGFLPTLAALPADARFGIAFFGTFLLMGLWDGFVQTRKLVRNAVITVRNLRAGRPAFAGTQSVAGDSIFDSVKVLLFVGAVAYALVGIVVVAGGGAFGSAGATLHW